MNPALVVEGPTEKLERLLDELDGEDPVTPVSRPRQEGIWRLCFDLGDDGSDSTAFERRESFHLALEILNRIMATPEANDVRRMLLIQLSINVAKVWDTSASLDHRALIELASRGCGVWVTASLVSDK